MKALVNRFLFALALPFVPLAAARADTHRRVPSPTLAYSIDLNRRADDLFHVTLPVSGLGAGERHLPVRLDGAGHLPGHEHRPVREGVRGVRRAGAAGCRRSRSRSTSGG